mmetsp:Transcript_17758/g.40992  ORF Transcript_17758/g.40992 Transcript_17758/m.40992 type:complete len:256 (-) Transcript_17758:2845-3612(-)
MERVRAARVAHQHAHLRPPLAPDRQHAAQPPHRSPVCRHDRRAGALHPRGRWHLPQRRHRHGGVRVPVGGQLPGAAVLWVRFQHQLPDAHRVHADGRTGKRHTRGQVGDARTGTGAHDPPRQYRPGVRVRFQPRQPVGKGPFRAGHWRWPTLLMPSGQDALRVPHNIQRSVGPPCAVPWGRRRAALRPRCSHDAGRQDRCGGVSQPGADGRRGCLLLGGQQDEPARTGSACVPRPPLLCPEGPVLCLQRICRPAA